MTTNLRDQLQTTLSGHYTLERELGGGGMSKVFVADELRLKRKVVVKVLSPELAQGISVERFEREIQTVAALQHANIVPVHTAGDTNGLPFYTMPFVEGESLRARLARGPLAVTEVIAVLRDVTRALAYAHQRGVVHRDIKPDNVLLAGGAAVVTDFGIAKAISASRTGSGAATLTQIGTSIGTPAYMAPEQAAGDPEIDHRADIYSLGAMAYELLSGQAVFANRTPQRMLAAHMGEAPKPITEFRGDLPPALADLVMQCLAKEASDRPQQAGDIARVLDTITSSGGMQSMPPVLLGGPAMFRKALAIYAGAFVAVAILAKAAIVGIGLPDWVFPGSLVVMALGLPVILWTGYVQRVARHAMTMTPTYTPGGSPSVAHGTIATMALKAAPKMSWYRTARGGAYAFGAFIAAIAAFMGMRAFGIGPFGSLFSSGKLSASDAIVMTDFSVTNGDTSLARVVSFAVRSALAQSSELRILDQTVVASALDRMERPRNARVDLALAQGVAIREGAKAIIDGEVTAIGAGFVLTVRLLTSDSAKTLASAQANGEGTSGLISAADEVARSLRAKVGESLRSVQNAVPLERARTASLEALRLFSEGVYANNAERNSPKAVRLLEQAVAADSLFAQAWSVLGASMSNSQMPASRVNAAHAMAFRLRSRLPEAERVALEANYYGFGSGRDRAKAIAAYERAFQLGGNRATIANQLAVLHRSRREFDAADSLYRLGISLDSTQTIQYAGLHRVLVYAGREKAADSLLAISLRRFPRVNTIRYDAISRSHDREEYDETAKQLDSARGVRDVSDPAAPFRASASYALLRGQVRAWRAYLSQALAADLTLGRRGSTAVTDANTNLLVAAFMGRDTGPALREFEAALASANLQSLPDADRPDLQFARTLAMAGRSARARALLADYRATIRDTALLRAAEPAIQTTLAIIAQSEGKYAEAITGFRRGDLAPDGPVDVCTICLPDHLSRAFDAANQPDSAIIQYEKFVSTPMWQRQGFDGSRLPRVHERLGQLYEGTGDAAKAAAHYRKFIELWKNADPELQPRVRAARDRLAKLAPVERARP